MPRANQYTIELRRQTAAYSQERDRQIIANSLALIDPVTQDLEDRLLVLINRGQGGGDGVAGSCKVVWDAYVEKLAATMEKLLLRQIQWSYEASTEALIASLPMKFWLLRAAPAGEFAVAVEHREPAGVGFVEEVSFEDEYQRIIDGESSRQEAIDIVREMEFPPPDADTIDRYLTQTSADDGLSAMERIKTVEPDRAADLQQIITDAFSAENLKKASAIEYAAPLIRELVGNDPGKPSGMNYRAKRIARTEGVRISQQALHDSWDAVDEIIGGRQWGSALAPNTRPDHAERHRKIYHKRNGEYIADDGEVQPIIPLGPNCLCWDTPILRDDLTAGLPPENVPAWLDEDSLDELDEWKKARADEKPKPRAPWYSPDKPLPKTWEGMEKELERLTQQNISMMGDFGTTRPQRDMISDRRQKIWKAKRDLKKNKLERISKMPPLARAFHGSRTPWRKYEAKQVRERLAREHDVLEAKRLAVVKSGKRSETRITNLRKKNEDLGEQWEALITEETNIRNSIARADYPDLRVAFERRADELRDQGLVIADKMDKAREQMVTSVRNRNANAMKKLKVDRPAKVLIHEEGLDAGTKQSVRRAGKFYDGILDSDNNGWGEGGAFESTAKQIPLDKEQRASAYFDISLGKNEDFGTTVHELGHVMEHRNLEQTRMVEGFHTHRIGNERPSHFKTKWPDLDYRDSEVGMEDEFAKVWSGVYGEKQAQRSAFYTGKYYDGGSTEITSMGMELLARDPVGFAERDPEYFRFMTGLLDGSLLK